MTHGMTQWEPKVHVMVDMHQNINLTISSSFGLFSSLVYNSLSMYTMAVLE